MLTRTEFTVVMKEEKPNQPGMSLARLRTDKDDRWLEVRGPGVETLRVNDRLTVEIALVSKDGTEGTSVG